jgi:hypothetical protein
MEISIAPSNTVETLLDVEELKKNFSTDLLFSVVKRYNDVNINAKITIVKGIEEISGRIQEELEKDDFTASDSFWVFLAVEYPFLDLVHASLRNMPVDTSVIFMTTYAPQFTYEEYQEFCNVLSKAPKSNVYGLPLSYIEKVYPFQTEDN